MKHKELLVRVFAFTGHIWKRIWVVVILPIWLRAFCVYKLENKDNKKEIEKPFYKREAFVVSTIVFSIFMLVGIIQLSNNTETPSGSEIIIPPTPTPTQQTLPVTPTKKIPFADLPKCDPAIEHCANSPVQSIPQEKSIADVVTEWTPRVPLVVCMWRNPNTGQSIQIGRGSGTIYNFIDGFKVITNRHVLVSEQYGAPNDCTAIFPQNKDFTVYFKDRSMQAGTLEDYGYLKLPNDPDLSKFNNNLKVCSSNSVNIGDKLVVLGYPVIGGNYGITATEGIISAIEPDYYVTGAKIDHGNSGGAAILIKDNCYLGIPSSSKVGEIESMGRILKASFVIN